MVYDLRQWPPSVQKDEIDKLPTDAVAAILVLFREMRKRGPKLEEYKYKPLPKHLHGLSQINMKINNEQIRILFAVYGQCIVILCAFKKTSPQIEKRAYQNALARKKAAESLMSGGANGLATIH